MRADASGTVAEAHHTAVPPTFGAGPDMPRLLVMGTAQVVSDDRVRPAGTQKVLALAGYLAVRGEPVARDHLTALLWPSSGPEQARRSLRGEVSRLRCLLGEQAVRSSRMAIWLDPARIPSDVQLFRAALADGREDEAVELYRGPLLDGLDLRKAEPFEEWLQGERHLLEMRYLDTLRMLIDSRRGPAAAGARLQWAYRAIRCQPLAEDFYVHAMEAADELGDRPSALMTFRRLEELLDLELGITPGAPARTLATSLSGPPGPPPAAHPAPEGTASPDGTSCAPTSTPPYVGRAAEQRTLREIARRAAGGQGSVVLVHGPAGIGKTRLLRTCFGEEHTLWCTAQRTTSVVPHHPIATGLRRQVLRHGVPDLDDVWLQEASRICPEIGEARRTPSLGGPGDEVRLIEGLSATLAAAAGRGGVVVVDDVQWADPDTVRVLDEMARRIPEHPLLIVLVARSRDDLDRNGVADLVSAATDARRLTELAVAGLSRTEIAELLSTADDVAAGDEFAGLIYDMLGGNPLYALECLRLAREEPGPGDRGSRDAIMSGASELLRARLRALPTDLRELADAAAVAGEPCTADLLGRVTRTDPDRLADRLDALIGHGVLALDRGAVSFVHDALAEVAYDSLPAARRTLLHARAADALIAADTPAVARSGQIAGHLEACGRAQEAVAHHERAADFARRSHAHQVAIQHTRRLRELCTDERQATILLQLGELLSYSASDEAEASFHAAIAAARRHADGHTQARGYLALGVLWQRRPELSRTQSALSEALRRFRAYRDTDGVERALEALTFTYVQQGKLTAAAWSAGQATELARETGKLHSLGRATLALGVAHHYGGDQVKALEHFERARLIAKDTDDELSEGEALRYLSAVIGWEGRLGSPEQAWAAAEQAMRICIRLGHRVGLARALDGAGGAYLLNGESARSLDCYVTALSIMDKFRYVWGLDAMMYRIGCAFLAARETAAAGRALRNAELVSQALSAPYWTCRIQLSMAELALHEGDWRGADVQAAAAERIARSLHHESFLAAAHAVRDGARLRHPIPTAGRGRPTLPAGAGPIALSDTALPDLPQVVDPPVRGVAAVTAWLDDIAERQLP